MTKEELIDILDSWKNMEVVVREITQNPEYFRILLDIAFYNKEQRSWRAAYVVDKIHDIHPELLLPFFDEMVVQLKNEKSSSKKRHFLKLISMNPVNKKHQGSLVDFCLETFTSAKEPIAVRVHAMQILFNISENEPDLKPEILTVIEHEMKYHASAGITSRGSKLAKELYRQIAEKQN
jgi:hypothetical protein